MRERRFQVIHLSVLTLALLWPDTSHAKKAFKAKVPNGNVHECSTCHIKTSQPATWNPFGLDVKANLVNNQPDWSAVCEMDSDGDGWTNGEELLDPECVWSSVMASPGSPGDVTKPGDASSSPPEPEPEPEPDVIAEQEEDAGGAEPDGSTIEDAIEDGIEDTGPVECDSDMDCPMGFCDEDGQCQPYLDADTGMEAEIGDAATDVGLASGDTPPDVGLADADAAADPPASSGGSSGSSGGCSGGTIPAHTGLLHLFGLLAVVVLSNRRRTGLV